MNTNLCFVSKLWCYNRENIPIDTEFNEFQKPILRYCWQGGRQKSMCLFWILTSVAIPFWASICWMALLLLPMPNLGLPLFRPSSITQALQISMLGKTRNSVYVVCLCLFRTESIRISMKFQVSNSQWFPNVSYTFFGVIFGWEGPF